MYYSKNKRFLLPLFFLAAIAGFSLLVMLLWNAVVPAIFNLPEIAYSQAILLLILTRLLFGVSPFRNYHHAPYFMHDKLKKMSPEEREEFKKSWSKMRQPPRAYHREQPVENQRSKTEDSESN